MQVTLYHLKWLGVLYAVYGVGVSLRDTALGFTSHFYQQLHPHTSSHESCTALLAHFKQHLYRSAARDKPRQAKVVESVREQQGEKKQTR